jgi:hypothetical protein
MKKMTRHDQMAKNHSEKAMKIQGKGKRIIQQVTEVYSTQDFRKNPKADNKEP